MRKLIFGENDLGTLRPDLAAEWHPTKNAPLRPQDVLPGTGQYIWWICDSKHEWQAYGYKRLQGAGCPICSGRRVSPGTNDIEATHPHLAAQWNSTKNGELKPSEVTVNRSIKVWWVCDLGHEWEARIAVRASGAGCPVCVNQQTLIGFNDLATTNPDIAAQWHPTKNGELTAKDLTAGSNRKVWWLCAKGHESQATVASRSKGTACTYCINQSLLVGFNDLATTNPDIAAQWHPTKNGELTAKDVIAGSARKVWWLCVQGHEWRVPIVQRNANGSGCPYCSGRFAVVGENDLATTHPQIAREWHPSRNTGLHLSAMKAGTNGRVWWICSLGHEWQAVVASRTSGSGCPICGGQKVLGGFNDLATSHPQIAARWHPTKNGDLQSSEVIAGSGKKFWWQCEFDHEWSATGASRVNGSGCPVCSNSALLVGFNDLATTNPDIAAQWHPTKNGELTAIDIMAGSSKRIWWMCPMGHEWESITSHRTHGSGCPTCSGKMVLIGFNDLATTNPDIAAQWHPTKNGDLTPFSITAGSQKKVWWQCPKGHDWETVTTSLARGSGCPECASYGFDPGKPAILYFISNKVLSSRKIGITNVGTSRLESFSKAGWLLVFSLEFKKGEVAKRVEGAIFSWLRGDQGLSVHLGPEEMGRVGGWTETFSPDGPSDGEVIEKIKVESKKVK